MPKYFITKNKEFMYIHTKYKRCS